MTQWTAADDALLRTGSRRMRVGLAAACVLALWLAGCGDNQREKLAGETVATMEELNQVLDGVKDEPTAKAAAPKAKQLVDRLADQMDRLRKLANASPGDPPAKAFGDKYEKRFRDASRGIGLNLMAFRLDIGIRRHLDESITRYDATMKSAAPAAGATP